jgi:protein TonB
VAERVEPAVTHKGTFRYPEAAAEEGVQGVVKLKVLVTEDGLVAEVEITRSSGDRRLDQAAKEWVRGWKYSPAVQAGKPRRVYTHATVEFELR